MRFTTRGDFDAPSVPREIILRITRVLVPCLLLFVKVSSKVMHASCLYLQVIKRDHHVCQT